jgi:hypothetical protein
MLRDAYPGFEDLRSLRGQIETALEERLESQQIEWLLRFWRAQGRPEMFCGIVRWTLK